MTLPVQRVQMNYMANTVAMFDLKFSQQLNVGLHNIISQKSVLFMGVIATCVDKRAKLPTQIQTFTQAL
jgi:hypothetical protein